MMLSLPVDEYVHEFLMSDWRYTADIPDDFPDKLVALCKDLECEPLDMLGCWMSESGLHSSAYNKGGDAAGIFQVIGSTRRQIGFHGTADEYLALDASQQLDWARKFYMPYRGMMKSGAGCYLATFLPALVRHSGDNTFVVCAEKGPFSFAYAGNWRAFDPEQKGYINVGDLQRRINSVMRGPRWEELAARVTNASEGDPEDRTRLVTIEEP